MTPRQKAAAIATQFEGRCTCAMMDGGVDCPWCQVYYDVLQGYPIVPPRPRAPGPAITIAPTA
jgi:hypothetical protein